ncbi:MAG: hypothetical protein GC156_09910 [Actinomycetales bacterium]|nr:hypothetical protein [Actinomycetales bacterium]
MTTILASLQAVQAEHGYVPDDAIARVAEACNASRADVYGVLTFYRDLRTTPPPAVTVRVCQGEACQAVGARALMRQASDLSSDHVAIDHVYCLGNCALGPACEVNGRLLGRATGASIAEAIQEARP